MIRQFLRACLVWAAVCLNIAACRPGISLSTSEPMILPIFSATPANLTPEHSEQDTPAAIVAGTPVGSRPESTPGAIIVPATPAPTRSVAKRTPLADDGPYIIFQDQWADPGHLEVMDLTGGCQTVDLPVGGKAARLEDGLSPDGIWLVYYSEHFTNQPQDVDVHLYSLFTGETQHVMTIYLAPEDNSGQLKSLLAWSPDNRTLAIMVAISVDVQSLFIYDVQSTKIYRIGDVENIHKLHWSIDSRYLLLEAFPAGKGQEAANVFVYARGETAGESSLVMQRKVRGYGLGWLTPTGYLLASPSDRGLWAGLRLLDMSTNKISELWKGSFKIYAIDPEHQKVALISPDSSDKSLTILVLVDRDGGWQQLTAQDLQSLHFRGGRNAEFLTSDTQGHYLFSSEGKESKLSDWGLAWNSVSPDSKWLIMFDENKLELFDENNQLTMSLPYLFVNDVYWRPDSAGFVFTAGSDSYYQPVTGGEPDLLMPCQLTSFWLPGASRTWLDGFR